MEDVLTSLRQTIVAGNRSKATELTGQLLAANIAPKRILDDGLIAGMSDVGELFKGGQYFIPEMLIAARAMKEALKLLRPLLVDTGIKPTGTVVIGTVQGDLHDIGKNLAGMFLEGAGFRVVDLGVNVSATSFVGAVKEHKAELVAMSALLTTTLLYTVEVIKALEADNLRSRVKVIIGGAPVTQEWADKIGADGFAPDAATGADRCRELLVQDRTIMMREPYSVHRNQLL
jgi:5-methyltetrahydrofolate--homocysteine methyltransferase